MKPTNSHRINLPCASDEAQAALDRILTRNEWMEGFSELGGHFEPSERSQAMPLTEIERAILAIAYEIRRALGPSTGEQADCLSDVYEILNSGILPTLVKERLASRRAKKRPPKTNKAPT